jgi:DnaK suppressor protein
MLLTNGEKRVDMDFDRFRTLLNVRCKELEGDSDQAAGSRHAVELDQQSVGRVSRIDAIQRQEMAKAGEQRRLNEMSRIRAALRRIDHDEYGLCLRCGEEIAIKRLEFDPAVPLCIGCARGEIKKTSVVRIRK